MKIYGYLRVSTIDQDTEKNKADILSPESQVVV
jgi:DNA invertase Pin-like site-specific DNA recombinase